MPITNKDWVKIVGVIIVVVLTLGLVGACLQYYAAQQTAKEIDNIFEDLYATPKPSTLNMGSTDTPTWTASKELGPEGKVYDEKTGEITYYNATIILTYSGPPMINLAIHYVYNTDPNNWDSERIYYGERRIIEEGFTLTYNSYEFLIDGEVTKSTFQIKWTLASNGNQGEVFIEV
jgi:hypothetical protein